MPGISDSFQTFLVMSTTLEMDAGHNREKSKDSGNLGKTMKGINLVQNIQVKGIKKKHISNRFKPSRVRSIFIEQLLCANVVSVHVG